MQWAVIIESNRAALLSVVVALLDLAGLTEDGKMRRQLRNYLTRILRPAESAARRLIVIAARDLVVDVRPPRSVILGPDPRTQSVKPGKNAQNPAFPLLDPLKNFAPRRRYSRSVPRILFLDGPTPPPLPPIPSDDDMVDATGVCRRLASVRRALDDIDAQARRLARWRARRDREPYRTGRLSPMRPGYAPGRRKRQIHEVDEILRNCHLLALHALSPNSS
ncbi:hypothetical protein [Oricola indica]|uniref:hypothetical protein n=1 Tax=Oricola indica TaxID=2872591 RepID=UPI003CCBA4FD